MSATNDLTKAAIDFLTLKGCFVWRQNNLAVKGRTFRGKKGVPDIVGVMRNGSFIGVEIKTGKDVLSKEQMEFFREVAQDRGGYYIAIGTIDELLEWWGK